MNEKQLASLQRVHRQSVKTSLATAVSAAKAAQAYLKADDLEAARVEAGNVLSAARAAEGSIGKILNPPDVDAPAAPSAPPAPTGPPA